MPEEMGGQEQQAVTSGSAPTSETPGSQPVSETGGSQPQDEEVIPEDASPRAQERIRQLIRERNEIRDRLAELEVYEGPAQLLALAADGNEQARNLIMQYLGQSGSQTPVQLQPGQAPPLPGQQESGPKPLTEAEVRQMLEEERARNEVRWKIQEMRQRGLEVDEVALYRVMMERGIDDPEDAYRVMNFDKIVAAEVEKQLAAKLAEAQQQQQANAATGAPAQPSASTVPGQETPEYIKEMIKAYEADNPPVPPAQRFSPPQGG